MGITHYLTSGSLRLEPGIVVYQSGVLALSLFCYFAFLALKHPEIY